MDNHGIRYYDPEVGRYISQDPAGYTDGMNVYVYVHDNPINHVDPLGLEGEEDNKDSVLHHSVAVQPTNIKDSLKKNDEYNYRNNPTPEQMRKDINKTRPSIYVYEGHADKDNNVAVGGSGEKVETRVGSAEVGKIKTDDLSNMLNANGNPPKVVVITACHGDEVAQRLTAGGTPLVVAGGTIRDGDRAGDEVDSVSRAFVGQLFHSLKELNGLNNPLPLAVKEANAASVEKFNNRTPNVGSVISSHKIPSDAQLSPFKIYQAQDHNVLRRD